MRIEFMLETRFMRGLPVYAIPINRVDLYWIAQCDLYMMPKYINSRTKPLWFHV